jgi:hypothetical protein
MYKITSYQEEEEVTDIKQLFENKIDYTVCYRLTYSKRLC